MQIFSRPFCLVAATLYVWTRYALFQDLYEKQIGCCGTIRKHPRSFPRTNKNDFPNRTERGKMRWLRRDKLLLVKWMDTREVGLCSTIHEAFSGKAAQRNVKEAGVWGLRKIPAPDAVLDYNKHVGGVDVSDALIGTRRLLTTSWTSPSSTVLFCRVLTRRQFREYLAAEMLHHH